MVHLKEPKAVAVRAAALFAGEVQPRQGVVERGQMLHLAGACAIDPNAVAITILHIDPTDGLRLAHDLQRDAVLVVAGIFPVRALAVDADVGNVHALLIRAAAPVCRDDDGTNRSRVHPPVMVVAQFRGCVTVQADACAAADEAPLEHGDAHVHVIHAAGDALHVVAAGGLRTGCKARTVARPMRLIQHGGCHGEVLERCRVTAKDGRPPPEGVGVLGAARDASLCQGLGAVDVGHFGEVDVDVERLTLCRYGQRDGPDKREAQKAVQPLDHQSTIWV